MSPIISIKEFNYGYKHHEIFKDADIKITEGYSTGLIGPNGSGKTTLFNFILDHLDSQESPIDSRLARNQVGLMSQEFTMPSLMTVEEASALLLYLNQSPYSHIARLTKNWSEKEKSKFEKIRKQRCGTCSLGERKWIYLRVLLSISKDLYILDEPTAGVDPEYRFEIWSLINSEQLKGKTFLISSHLLSEVTENCDQIYMIRNYQLESYSSKYEIFKRFNTENLDEAFINAYSK